MKKAGVESHFYYIFGGRRDLVRFLPANATGCEIGVQRGVFSQIILDNATPIKLHLIDPWRHSESKDYSRDLANVRQNEQEAIYDSVVKKFERAISIGQVILHRKTSDLAAADFDDASLDFVYVDGMHNFEGVLSDLIAYAPKLKPGGILFGHDYSENFHSFRMGFGVVGAVSSFIKRSEFRLIALTHETWSTFALASTIDEGPAKFLVDALLNSEVGLIGLPVAMASNLTHEEVRRKNGTTRWLPLF